MLLSATKVKYSGKPDFAPRSTLSLLAVKMRYSRAELLETGIQNRHNAAALPFSKNPHGEPIVSRNFPAMSAPKRINDPEANSLPVEMQELARLVDSISGPEKRALSAAYERVAESILRRRRILNLVQEALSQLRLDVKYLMFDLETTRRERDQLQSQLEENDRGF